MPEGLTLSLGIVIVLAVVFDFINGFHDTANAIATSVSTRVLRPAVAIVMAAALNFAGALVSDKVAKTISGGLVQGSVATRVVVAALIGAIVWDLITWRLGLPSSSSHALVGALIGAAIVDVMSFQHIIWKGLLDKVVLPLVLSPVAGFVFGFIIMKFLFFALRRLSQRAVNRYFSKLQILSAALMAFSHGTNDAQKSMGIITLALIGQGLLRPKSDVPPWVIILCATAMALGTSVGGWRIIKTIGMNMIKLQPVNGFAAETAGALVIEASALMGMNSSTTHVISSSIMGVGAAKRFSAVRWNVVKSMVYAWVITLPVTALIGGGAVFLIKLVMR